ncbi:MAG TPA: DUF2721 domain-containing protein [Xanthobacteraceae bacterium]|nr:DUF2721 domain-containing protein [Xanthobacteraceae bacterium]
MLLNLVPNATQLQAMFAQAAAPAFLLAAIAAFISILMARTAALMAQIRGLSEIPDSDPVRTKLKDEIPHLKRRAFLLHRAAYLGLLAGIATACLLVLMSLYTFFGVERMYGAGFLFAVAVGLFISSLFNFAMEVRVALRELHQL